MYYVISRYWFRDQCIYIFLDKVGWGSQIFTDTTKCH